MTPSWPAARRSPATPVWAGMTTVRASASGPGALGVAVEPVPGAADPRDDQRGGDKAPGQQAEKPHRRTLRPLALAKPYDTGPAELPGPALGPENQRGVGAAEPEGIRQHVGDLALARLLRHEVDVAGRRRVFEVERRRRPPGRAAPGSRRSPRRCRRRRADGRSPIWSTTSTACRRGRRTAA